MGGTMPYLRFRHRNGLEWRPSEDQRGASGVDPYARRGGLHGQSDTMNRYSVLGDLNRFERDVLGVGPFGDELAAHYAEIAAADIETVRRVLAAVFLDPDYAHYSQPILDWPPAEVVDVPAADVPT